VATATPFTHAEEDKGMTGTDQMIRRNSSSSTSKQSVGSGEDLGSDMLQSDPKAFTRLTKKKIDELVAGEWFSFGFSQVIAFQCLLSGAYFLMHTKLSTQQKFISCSDDLSRILFWGSFNDKDDGVAPSETMNFAEVLGVSGFPFFFLYFMSQATLIP